MLNSVKLYHYYYPTIFSAHDSEFPGKTKQLIENKIYTFVFFYYPQESHFLEWLPIPPMKNSNKTIIYSISKLKTYSTKLGEGGGAYLRWSIKLRWKVDYKLALYNCNFNREVFRVFPYRQVSVASEFQENSMHIT